MSSAVTSPALPGSDDGGSSPPVDGGEGSEGLGSACESAKHSTMLQLRTLWCRVMMVTLLQNMLRPHASTNGATKFPLRLELFGVKVRSSFGGIETI